MATSLLTRTFYDWLDDSAPRTAAALAYYTVFSLAPLLLIAVGVAGMLFGEDAARERILEQASAILGASGGETVQRLMGDRQTASQAGLVSTIVGLVTLLIGAVGVLSQLKDALNTVWDVKPPEEFSWLVFLRQYLMNFALVIATGFLVLVSLLATAMLGAATAAARSWISGPDALWFVLDAATGLALTTAVFALIFRVIPDAPVAWRDAWLGGLFTAVLFTVGRIALGIYLGREAGQSAYDAAASLLALLAWVYYSSQLVLFGAEFTHALGDRRAAAIVKPTPP